MCVCVCVGVCVGGRGVCSYSKVRRGDLERNFIANSEWALLEALCVVLFEDILVQMCVA